MADCAETVKSTAPGGCEPSESPGVAVIGWDVARELTTESVVFSEKRP